MFSSFGAVKNLRKKKPVYGQILYLASCDIESRYGRFKAHVFQNLHSKDYCIALCQGAITTKQEVTSRIHSSCITSETLRGLDSDDIQQLELALSIIGKKKRGILYYLIQEGRGVGFTAKARDRMLVQSVKNLSSHDAFKLCGLHDDYRIYDSVSSINHLLGVQAALHLLTNSPHKVQSIRNAGIKVAGTSSLLVQPYSHSLGYLKSKAAKGHTLSKGIEQKSLHNFDYISIAPKPITPFTPYAIDGAERFIHTASYLFPIKPVHGALILNKSQLQKLTSDLQKICKNRKTFSVLAHEADRYVVQLNRTIVRSSLQSSANALLSVPYWFTLHAYYDVASGEDVILLEYGDCKKSKTTPLVRVHSESLFNRFPLEDVENRDKYKKSIFEIVRHGAGIVLLLQNDGRGAGFGIFALEKMLLEQRQAVNSSQAYKQLGISYDVRDYHGAALLIKNHLRRVKPRVTLLTSSKKSLTLKPESVTSLQHAGITVEDIIFLSTDVKLPKA